MHIDGKGRVVVVASYCRPIRVQLDQLGLSPLGSSTQMLEDRSLVAESGNTAERRLLTVHIRAEDSIWSPVHSPHTAEMATKSLIKLIKVLNCAYKHNFVAAPQFSAEAQMAQQFVQNSNQKPANKILVRVGGIALT